MEVSPNFEVASLLPRLRHGLPGQDLGQVVVITFRSTFDFNTTADVDDIVDQRCS